MQTRHFMSAVFFLSFSVMCGEPFSPQGSAGDPNAQAYYQRASDAGLKDSSLEVAEAGKDAVTSSSLTLVIKNVKEAQGQVCYSLFNEEGKASFGEENPQIPPYKADCSSVTQTGTMEIEISDLPHGIYAAAIFHDLNSNDTLDTGMFSAPKEPIGLSTVKEIPFRKPNFEECQFAHQSEGQQTIVLKRFTLGGFIE